MWSTYLQSLHTPLILDFTTALTLFYIFNLLYVCVYTCARMCFKVCSCMWKSEVNLGWSSRKPVHLVYWNRLFLYPEIFNLASLAGQKVPEILLFQLPSAGIISNHSFQLFKWVLGIKFRSLCYYASHLSGLILMLSFNLILFNCPTKTAVLILLRGNFQKWDFIPETANSSVLVRD